MSGLTPNFESVIEQINFLACLSGLNCEDFRHELIGVTYPDPIVVIPKILVTYTIPENSCLIITRISVSTIPPVNDASLTVGDWRSEYYDASGTAKLWIDVNGNPKTPANAIYFILANRPLLFLFNGGEKFELIVQRATLLDVPPTMRVLVSIDTFLAPAKAYDLLSRCETQVIATYLP